MEITKLSKNALKLKGKKATLLIDVIDIKKTEANAYVFLEESVLQVPYDKETLLISGPGDYEVSGSKVVASKIADALFYEITIDGVKILLTHASKLALGKDKLNEQQVLLLLADAVIDQSMITNFSPAVVMTYGEQAEKLSEVLGKGLGKNESEGETTIAEVVIKPVDKFSVTADKLPAELQVVLLA